MSYSTVAQVRLALVPSISDPANPPTTRTNTAADFSNDQLQDAINEADSQIDAYIGKFYATPVAMTTDPGTGDLTVVPHPLDYWSRNIAAYNASLTYRGSQDLADQDPVVRRYNGTMAALNAVNAGKATLPLPRNVSDSSATQAGNPVNPYVGDLFDPTDFDLRPADFDPVYGPNPYWWGRW